MVQDSGKMHVVLKEVQFLLHHLLQGAASVTLGTTARNKFVCSRSIPSSLSQNQPHPTNQNRFDCLSKWLCILLGVGDLSWLMSSWWYLVSSVFNPTIHHCKFITWFVITANAVIAEVIYYIWAGLFYYRWFLVFFFFNF